MKLSNWQVLTTAVVLALLQLAPAAPAQAGGSTTGSITCGRKGHAAYTIAFARNRGLLSSSRGPGPTGKEDFGVKIKTAPVGDPASDNTYGLPEVGIWTFVGNLPNIDFGASQLESGGSYSPQFEARQCTKQAAPTGTVVKRYRDSEVSCPAGSRVVVWSDGWGNHWVSYRSTPDGRRKRVKTMFSNYQTLKMGSAFIDERKVFDVKLFATTSKPKDEWPEDFMPGHDIRCNTDGWDPKLQ